METSINGTPTPWTPEILSHWHSHVTWRLGAEEAEKVWRANYFTPRPYVDEYNRGSTKAGFCYTIGRHVYMTEWTP